MSAKRMTNALLIALSVSGVCTYALSRRMARPVLAQQVQMLQYVAPVHALQSGEVIKRENLEMVSWPANQPLSGAFHKPEELLDRTVIYPIDMGQPITDKFVTAPGAGVGMASHIPDGMRAIALRCDEVMGVGGFLLPGSHVDVLVTYRTSPSSPDLQTATVMQNAEVLAAGHQIDPQVDGKPITATVVTLLLTPEDAERAVLASSQGTIHFVMRSGSDKQQIKEAPALLSQLGGGAAPAVSGLPRPAAVPEHVVAAVPRPAGTTVETILGDKTSTQTFGANLR